MIYEIKILYIHILFTFIIHASTYFCRQTISYETNINPLIKYYINELIMIVFNLEKMKYLVKFIHFSLYSLYDLTTM